MAQEYGGILFIFDEAGRTETLVRKIKSDGKFSDTISIYDLHSNNFEFCLHSFDGNNLSYAGLIRLGRPVATAKNRVLFSNFISFKPISFHEISQRSAVDFVKLAVNSSRGMGKRLDPQLWDVLLNTIISLQPDISSKFSRLEQLRNTLNSSFQESGLQIVAQEKDSVGLALDIFGIEREEILFSWSPVSTKPTAPFLIGLRDANIREDPMVIRDARSFGNWKEIDNDMVGSIDFYKEGERLTITNFNRHKVEENTGVDLVYYHHKFNSYVMVQYKRMTVEEGRKKQIVYRPLLDDSYVKEIKRMKDLARNFPPDNNQRFPNYKQYRLHTCSFYFKLCLPFRLELSSSELIKGMYFPLDYWEQLLESELARGTRDGVRIVYQESDRHINNTLFIELVQHGWIGSRLNDTTILTEVIKESLERKRSITVAQSESI